MDTTQAEAQFRQLERQLKSRNISLQEYRAALEGLRVVDEWGRPWQMQERTGQWHVFHEGRWVAAIPPRPTGAPAPSSRPRLALKLGIGGAAVLMGLCVLAVGVGGFLWLNRGSFSTGQRPGAAETGLATEEALPPGEPGLTLKELGTVQVSPGAGLQVDANGVSMEAPAGTVAEGQIASLTAYEVDGRWEGALKGAYTLETPLYAIGAPGEIDGVGRAALSFPASSPASRLLAVIDGKYAAVLDIEPQDGRLAINPRLYPQGESVPGMGSSVQYSVLTPAGAARSRPAAGGSGGKLAAPANQDDNRDCTAPGFEGIVLSVCRKNLQGSVYVEYLADVALTTDQADLVADEVAATMGRYAELGFTAAKISPSNPVHVTIFSGSGDPQYSFKTGVIYIPLDIAQSMGSGSRFSLYHEMAHWIQDEEYVMLFAGVSGAGRWWMEVGAENMVMLIDESYVGQNLSTYGTIIANDPMQALQSSPYQWPTDFYVHAQQVKVNMCDGGACPISQASFIEAINKGVYPFDDSGAQAKLSANLDDYARYLLGVAPQKANAAIPRGGPVASGEGYGEEIIITETNKGRFNLTYDGARPQMIEERQGGLSALVVAASLDKDGVYPLRVSSGRNGKYSGLPAALKIGPGAPFWYRIDGGEAQFSDGSKELVIQPIQQDYGIRQVRIVAVGRQSGETFNARLEALSLEGTWVFKTEKLVSSSVVCSEAGDDSSDPSAFGALLIGLGSALGEYKTDQGGETLDWQLIPGRLPADADSSSFTYVGAAMLGPQNVQVQARMEIPRPAEGHRPSPTAAWGAGLLLPLGTVIALRRRWPGSGWIRPGALLLVSALLLAGCVGIGIYGDVEAQITFTHLEYKGGEDIAVYAVPDYPTSTPLWHLSGGQATYMVDLFIETEVTDPEGNTETSVSTCSGTAVYEVSADIFKDLTLVIEDQ